MPVHANEQHHREHDESDEGEEGENATKHGTSNEQLLCPRAPRVARRVAGSRLPGTCGVWLDP
jgi:hypothetical protein